MRAFSLIAGLGLLLCIVFAPRVSAATFCVDDAAALQSAINTAQGNDEDNEILLVKGSYALTGDLVFNSPYARSIALRGGYSAGCSVLGRFIAPANTVIDGQSVAGRHVLLVGLRGILVEGLSFQHLAGGNTSAIDLDGLGPDAYVEFRNNIAQNNSSTVAIVYAEAPGGGLIQNNLVTGNTAPTALDAIRDYPTRRVIYSHNTVVGNSGIGLRQDAAWLAVPVVLVSNILWNNVGQDMSVVGAPPFALNNIIGTQQLTGSLPTGSSGNLSVDPKLDANFRLTAASTAAINTGLDWSIAVPGLDIDGANRHIGSAPDRGAFESAVNDLGAAHTYTVTSTGDGTSGGTLRQAITAANAAGVPAVIKFNVGCGPAVIQLNSVLPDIKVPLQIDGYSQSGASRNTLRTGFDGKLCVALLRGSSTPYALRVAASSPGARLDVGGLVFSFFPGAALVLTDGTAHYVHGNSFGVSVPANGTYPGTGAVFGSNIAILVSSGAFANVIGGPAPSERNLVGNSSGGVGIGISLSAQATFNGLHTVQGNFIGTTANGLGASANSGDGVAIFASDYDEVSDNVIAANGGAGISIGALPSNNVNYALVHRNFIGENLNYAPLGNATAGVLISTGSAINMIGAPYSYGGGMVNANTIGANGGPGVWVDATAGNGNAVALNRFYGDTGMAIDLGALGPQMNDPGDTDSGPNDSMNTPTVLSAELIAPQRIALSGSFDGQANGFYTLNFYYSGGCGANGHGPGQQWLGSQYMSAPSGSFSVALTVNTPEFFPQEGGVITAVATSIGGDTSEFSACLTLDRDYLFQNGFESPVL